MIKKKKTKKPAQSELSFGSAKIESKPSLLSREDKPIKPQVIEGVGGKVTHKGITLVEYYTLEIYRELIRKSESSEKIVGSLSQEVCNRAAKLAKQLINSIDNPT